MGQSHSSPTVDSLMDRRHHADYQMWFTSEWKSLMHDAKTNGARYRQRRESMRKIILQELKAYKDYESRLSKGELVKLWLAYELRLSAAQDLATLDAFHEVFGTE